ncbi:MAG TPA: FAD-binding protein [Candidatus Saccharimonadales bacterium]|nr:FAD-binding protein [Candidatus Saccharimonadales bacterium]
MVNAAKNQELPIISRLEERFGDKFLHLASLKDYTSAGVGGRSDYLVIAETAGDLIDAAQIAIATDCPYLVLGAGHGVLVSDVGFPGLTIIDRAKEVSFEIGHSQMLIGSGITNNELVNTAAEKGLGGAEFLAAVPGTLGGAVVTGAGWGGKTIHSLLREVVMFLPGQDPQVVSVLPEQIVGQPFSSKIKVDHKFPPIILSVRLQLTQLAREEILKRLFEVRKRRNVDGCLGHVFTSSLADFLRKRDLKLPSGHGLSLNRKDPDLIVKAGSILLGRGKEKIDAQATRAFINQLKQLSLDDDEPLKERLRFVGHWVGGEEAEG